MHGHTSTSTIMMMQSGSSKWMMTHMLSWRTSDISSLNRILTSKFLFTDLLVISVVVFVVVVVVVDDGLAGLKGNNSFVILDRA